MPRVAKGHVEQLPSGSWRARVYAGVDPITQREIRLKAADVLDELERALVARGLESKAVTHRVGEMRRAFPDAEVGEADVMVIAESNRILAIAPRDLLRTLNRLARSLASGDFTCRFRSSSSAHRVAQGRIG